MPTVAAVLSLALFAPASCRAQGGPPEIDELRRRITVIRAELPEISALATKLAPFLAQAASSRLLIPRSLDPGFFLEFSVRAGGPPDTQDADVSTLGGLALLPVRHWDGTAFGVATRSERLQAQGRPVVVIGPASGRPDNLLGAAPFIDNGAPDGHIANASLNGVANLAAGWRLYAELVSAATRAGWRPGVLRSVLVAGADTFNASIRFRMPDAAPDPITAGTLGSAYLDAVDSILRLAADPGHRATMDSTAARLRELRQSGRRIFAGSCGHYLMEEIPRDAMISKTFAALPGDRRPVQSGAPFSSRGDAIIWFGYGGYDCPNATVADSFHTLGPQVVLVSDRPATDHRADLLAEILLPWQLPDGAIPLPFPPGLFAPLSSVDMAVHYVWLRRLLGSP